MGRPTTDASPGRPLNESARAGGILLAGSIVSKVLRLANDLLLGRVLGPAGFGVIAAATSLVGILGEIALLGTHRAALRFASLDAHGTSHGSLSRRAMAIPLLLGVLFAALITAWRVPLTRALFGNAVSPWILPTFAITIPAIGLFSISQFLARARRRFVVDTLVGDVCRMGLPFLGTIVCFAWKRSLEAAAWGFVAGTVATVVVGLALRGRPAAGESTPIATPSWGRLLRVGGPLALGSASILLLNELDKVMLAAFRPEEEVGVYNAAFRIARQILIVMPALNAAISPWVAPLLAQGRVDELRRLYKRTVQWSLAAGWSSALLFCGFSADFLGLFGDDYRSGSQVLIVICLGHLVNAAAGTVAVVIQYSGHEKKELVNGVLVMLVCLGLNITLIPRFGALGAATSSFLALTLVNTLRMVQAWRILDVMPYDRGTLGVLAAGAGGLVIGLVTKAGLAAVGGPTSPAVGVLAATLAMGAAWVVYFARVGVSEEEAAMLRLPARFVRSHGVTPSASPDPGLAARSAHDSVRSASPARSWPPARNPQSRLPAPTPSDAEASGERPS